MRCHFVARLRLRCRHSNSDVFGLRCSAHWPSPWQNKSISIIRKFCRVKWLLIEADKMLTAERLKQLALWIETNWAGRLVECREDERDKCNEEEEEEKPIKGRIREIRRTRNRWPIRRGWRVNGYDMHSALLCAPYENTEFIGPAQFFISRYNYCRFKCSVYGLEASLSSHEHTHTLCVCSSFRNISSNSHHSNVDPPVSHSRTRT